MAMIHVDSQYERFAFYSCCSGKGLFDCGVARLSLSLYQVVKNRWSKMGDL